MTEIERSERCATFALECAIYDIIDMPILANLNQAEHWLRCI